MALVIDCYSRVLLSWHLGRSGRSKTAESALEQPHIARNACLGKVKHPFLLRPDHGLIFTSVSYTSLVKSYGLQQELITHLGMLKEKYEQTKASMRAKVEYPFRVIKQQFGFNKVRWGIAKNDNKLQTMFALANLWLVRGELKPVQE